MKFYKLSVSSEPKVIGVNNGVYQGNIAWKKFELKNSEKKIKEGYFSLKKHLENKKIIEPIDFEIEYIEALKAAKLTDFFTYSPILWGVNYFVTKKVKDLLGSFKLPLSAFIPANIFHKGIKYEYYAFYVPVHYREDSFDFSNSVFYDGLPNSMKPKQYLNFNSIDDYRNCKPGTLKQSEKLAFNNNFDNTLDLFDSLYIGKGYIISESLKLAMEEAAVTGIVIREPEEPELVLNNSY